MPHLLSQRRWKSGWMLLWQLFYNSIRERFVSLYQNVEGNLVSYLIITSILFVISRKLLHFRELATLTPPSSPLKPIGFLDLKILSGGVKCIDCWACMLLLWLHELLCIHIYSNEGFEVVHDLITVWIMFKSLAFLTYLQMLLWWKSGWHAHMSNIYFNGTLL